MPAPQASASLLPGGEGRHYAQIKAAIPESLISASPALRAAITQAKPEIPAWYAATTPAQKAALQNLLEASIKSHTALEQATGKVQEVNAFARPLLEAALKNAGFELDVNQVHLRLYVPVEGLATGYRTKTLSLLQAALNNFEARETRAGFFDSASGFITAPGADGRFERHTTTLTIEAFARLCRDLDLGRLYQNTSPPTCCPCKPCPGTCCVNALSPGKRTPSEPPPTWRCSKVIFAATTTRYCCASPMASDASSTKASRSGTAGPVSWNCKCTAAS
ncbi:hypothetical protein P0D92_03405 [Pseudomonas sp. CBSPAW29]|nr:hypothetical protein P0D92_03405 [Pseudomonas sp. CBSPAW29]